MNTQTTYSVYAGGEAVQGRSFFQAIRRSMRRVMKSMMARHMERETVRELSGLPAHVLRDIGIQRDDIRTVAADMARENADAWARRAEASNGFGG